MVRDAARRAGPGKALRVTAPAPAVLHAAPGDVARVLVNLLANAVRHAEHTVRVAVLPGIDEVRVLVDDDGTGCPSSRERVFDRFHRVQDDGTVAPAGLGSG
ncbi:MAG: ATP-binding protein [Actinomycetota bacterium]|nr:ATP-binding protein [Actinomycetota bacterium]